MTVDEVIGMFFSHDKVKAMSVETRIRYKSSCNKFQDFCKKLGIEEFSSEIRNSRAEYVQYLRKRKLRPNTIKFEMLVIRRIGNFFGISLLGETEFDNSFSYVFNMQERQDYILRQGEKRLSGDDIEKLLAHSWDDKKLHLRNHLMIRIFLDTGIRAGEMAGITKADLNISKRECFISQSKTRKRWIFISPLTAQVASAYLAECRGEEDDYRLFPKDGWIWTIISTALDDIGIKKAGGGPHAFRHYFATHAHYVLNMSLKDVATIMGDTEQTIERNYLHPEKEYLRTKINEVMRWD